MYGRDLKIAFSMSKIIPKIISDIFTISFITFVVYLGLELIFEGLISNYFDLNILLVLLILGIINLAIKQNYEKNSRGV